MISNRQMKIVRMTNMDDVAKQAIESAQLQGQVSSIKDGFLNNLLTWDAGGPVHWPLHLLRLLLLVRDIDSWPLQMKQTEGNGRLLLPFVSGSLLRIARLVGDYWGWFLHESDHRSIEVNKQKPAPFNFFNY